MNRRKFISNTALISAVVSTPIILNSLDDHRVKEIYKLANNFKKIDVNTLSQGITEKYNLLNGVALSKGVNLFPLKGDKNSYLLVDEKNNFAKEINHKQVKAYNKFLEELHISIGENDKNGVIEMAKLCEPAKIIEVKSGLTHSWSFKNSYGNTIAITSRFRKQSTVTIS